MAALLSGQSVTEVAAQFNLGKATVSRWRSTISLERLEQIGTEKTENLERLLMNYVRQNLKTLTAQSEVAGRASYIEKQPASELAVLHGVMADKTVRILAAFEPSEVPAERTAEAAELRVN